MMNLKEVHAAIHDVNNSSEANMGLDIKMLRVLWSAKSSGYVKRVSLDPLKYEWTERGQNALNLQLNKDRFLKLELKLQWRYGLSSTKYYKYRRLALQKYIINS